MKGAFKLGQVAGIGIFMHWSFLLLLGWILINSLSQGQGMPAAFRAMAFSMAIFACVVLHELGHALTARRFKIRTRDITLLPIGGVARLERMPDNPVQELWVALAGPAVNVAIAAVLFVGISLFNGDFFNAALMQGGFAASLLFVNLFLVAFNMLPAFPMDGGRVLRALLAMRMDYQRATRTAARIGQGMAVIFGLVGLLVWFNPFLILIAVFVFFGARAEVRAAQLNAALRDRSVRDAMLMRFRALSTQDTLGMAVDELLAGAQQDFPVMEGGRIAGILQRNDLAAALAEQGREARVSGVMRRGCPVVNDTDSLRKTLELMRQAQWAALPVVRDGQLVGLVTLENIGERIMVDAALGRPTVRTD